MKNVRPADQLARRWSVTAQSQNHKVSVEFQAPFDTNAKRKGHYFKTTGPQKHGSRGVENNNIHNNKKTKTRESLSRVYPSVL
jgi:hypothetical protein